MTRLFLIVTLVFSAQAPAGALAGSGDRVSIGTDVAVAAGEVVDGHLVVLKGDARIDGKVQGDLVVLAGDVILGAEAEIQGDLAVGGGEVYRADGAKVAGSLVGISDEAIPADRLAARLDGAGLEHNGGTTVIELSPSAGLEQGGGFAVSLGSSLLVCALILVLGLLFMTIWPERSRNLRRTVEASPWASLLMGGLVSTGLGLMALLLTISVIGVLALPLLATAALAVWLAGLTGLLEAVGDRLPLPERLRSRGWDFIAGVGLFAVLGVLWAMGGLAAFLAFVITFGMGCVALGAGILSSLGRHPWPKA